jgi:hypothetical protein
MAALWFTWKTVQGEKRSPFLLIPLFSAMAYLTRPDGIEILLVFFLYVLFIKKFNTPGEKVWVILLVLFSSIVLFLPYLLYLKEETGAWTLSRLKGILEWSGWGVTEGEIPLTYKMIYSIKKLNLEIFAMYHPLYLFFLAVGLGKKVLSRPRPGESFLLLFCFLHYIVLFLLILNFTQWGENKSIQVAHFSGRHVLPLLLFSVYWVGEGFGVVCNWIQKKWGSIGLLEDWGENRKARLIWIALFILALAIVLPKTLKPQRYERVSEKMVGLWIKNQSGEGVTILTTSPRVAFYAKAHYELIDFKKDTLDKIEALHDKKKASYLVIKGQEAADFSREVDSIENKFMEVFQYEKEGMEKMIVYRRAH